MERRRQNVKAHENSLSFSNKDSIKNNNKDSNQ